MGTWDFFAISDLFSDFQFKLRRLWKIGLIWSRKESLHNSFTMTSALPAEEQYHSAEIPVLHSNFTTVIVQKVLASKIYSKYKKVLMKQETDWYTEVLLCLVKEGLIVSQGGCNVDDYFLLTVWICIETTGIRSTRNNNIPPQNCSGVEVWSTRVKVLSYSLSLTITQLMILPFLLIWNTSSSVLVLQYSYRLP